MEEQLREALGGLQKAVEEEEDPKELARYLMALNELRRLLGDLVDETSSRMYARLEKKETDLGEGIGIVARTREVNTTWNHEDLYQEIVRRHRQVDPITGEVWVDGQALANDIRSLVAFSYWRKTALRSRQIDPEEYSTVVFGKPRIRFLSREGKT